MRKIDRNCWEYRDYTIFCDDRCRFSYKIYDEEGFDLEAFSSLDDCRKYIDDLISGHNNTDR